MALMGLFGKKRVTESFFVNSYGNDQTRGIYTFQVDIENGEILYKKHFKTPFHANSNVYWAPSSRWPLSH